MEMAVQLKLEMLEMAVLLKVEDGDGSAAEVGDGGAAEGR